MFLSQDKSQFTTDWIQLSGRLHFDLESLGTGILPGIEVMINLEYSSNDFRLLSGETGYANNKDVVIEIGAVC